jgi:hypothetical protein
MRDAGGDSRWRYSFGNLLETLADKPPVALTPTGGTNAARRIS